MQGHMNARRKVLIALLALALAGCDGDQRPKATAPRQQAPSGPTLGTLEFEGYELGFRPERVEVSRPGRYAITFANVGYTQHDWSAGDTRLLADSGETVSGEVEVPAGGLEFICSIPGHAAAGMRGTITVAGE